MCSNLFFRFVNIGFFLIFFFGGCKVSNKASYSTSLNQVPVPGCLHSSRVPIVYVCLCVCASVCACENV